MVLGDLFLWLCFTGAVFSAFLFLLSTKGDKSIYSWGKKAYYLTFLFSLLATLLLFYLFLTHNFQTSYVFGYSSTDLPFFYLISSFWAGQEGTFLLWLFTGLLLGLFLINKKGNELQSYLLFFYLTAQIFLLVLLLKKSPFELLPETPLEGRGLNPLLKDPWMVSHPPLIFIGYAALAIPFAYALAALIKDKYDNWIKFSLPWIGFSALSLGAGIFVGGFWAYKVLGWGGYWGWDPVENASLIPWLTTIALFHGIILERNKESLKKSNLFLALISFLLVLYGTFLTRSGILADFSVHSFADLGINQYLIFFMLLFTAFSLGLLLFRSSKLKGAETGKSILSQDFVILLGIIFISLSAVLILVGTSAPIITGILGKASNVSVPYYIRTHLPLAIVLGLLLSFTPFLPWKEISVKTLSKTIALPLVIAIIFSIIAWISGVRKLSYFLFFFFSFFLVISNFMIFFKRLKGNLLNTAGYLTHIGIGFMFIGILTSSGFSKSVKLNLPKDEPKEAFGYQLVFQGSESLSPQEDKHLLVQVKKGKDNFIARPRLYWSEYNQAMMRKPHIKRKLAEDLYFAPLEYNQKEFIFSEPFSLSKGEEKEIEGYKIKFLSFVMRPHEQGGEFRVAAVLEVGHQDQKATATPAIIFKEQNQITQIEAQLPDDNLIFLEKVMADQKMVVLSIAQRKNESGEILVLEVSIKPLINILWLGMIVIMAGLFLTTWRRSREAKTNTHPK
ncbi:MAG: cytochrome c biogenesis protein CcsA [candidate division Zixibacteria bacterium]|nr:cytochrome c biogenesis protein CcsA [candidate division Zixibacteria bacterium]